MFGRVRGYHRTTVDLRDRPRQGCAGILIVSPALFVGAVALLGGVGHGTAHDLCVMLVGVLVAVAPTASLRRRSIRAGVSVDGGGLTEWYPLGFRRRTRWNRVDAVQATDFGIEILSGKRRVRIGPPLASWRTLAQRAAYETGVLTNESSSAATESPSAPVDMAVDPETVAAWLGIPQDGVLRCRPNFTGAAKAAVVSAAIAVFVVELIYWDYSLMGVLTSFFTTAVLGGSFFFFCTPLGRWCFAQLGGVDLNCKPGGIEQIGQDVFYHGEPTARGGYLNTWVHAWSGIRSVVRRGLFWYVNTTDGGFHIPVGLSNQDRLLHAIRQAIELRRSRLSLPRMTDNLTDAALSRAAAEPFPQERSLSLHTDDEGP